MTDTILIYDDEADIVEQWRATLEGTPEIRDRFNIRPVRDDELREEMDLLEERRLAARDRRTPKSTRESLLDAAAILVVDYDLLRMSGHLTGEAVAYLARCYSLCGPIVALNQFGDNTFDLTLRGHPESHADLNIGGSQLGKTGLWSENWTGFRPWAWPLLPEVMSRFKERVTAVEGSLDLPIVEQLRLSSRMVATLPLEAAEFLAQTTDVRALTFRQFASESGRCYRSKDQPPNDHIASRVAAARLWHWVECFLAAGQDILVDAPHLAQRYPSLLATSSRDRDSFNMTTSLTHPAPGLNAEQLERHAFPRPWSSRPLWLWGEISRDESILEVKDPFAAEACPWVFAEDLSAFIESEAAREFLASVDSPFARRYVAQPESDRLSELIRKETRAVEYRPIERLYL